MITHPIGVPTIHIPRTPSQILNINRLFALQKAIERDIPLVELEVTHHFAPGIYVREMFLPKGTVAVGKVHKTSHMTVISKGRLALCDENSMRILEAGAHFTSEAGTKRAVYVHEDSILSTIHPTDEKDPKTLERLLVVETLEQYETFLESLNLQRITPCLSEQSQGQ